MNILVFSDSHSRTRPMLDIYNRTPVDAIIHLGDYVRDARELMRLTSGVPVYHVAGNCDFNMGAHTLQILELGGAKIMITHGHMYQVKSGLGLITEAAVAKGVNAVFFGHTHIQLLKESRKILLLNPGAVSDYDNSYALVNIENGQINATLLRGNI